MVTLVRCRLISETDDLGSNPSSTTYYLYDHEQVTSPLRASVASSVKWG